MKRLSEKRRRRQMRRAERCAWHRARRKKQARSIQLESVDVRADQARGIYAAPVEINLGPGSTAVQSFLRTISEQVLNEKRSITLDFRRTKKLDMAGTILMYAEIDRICKQSELEKPLTIRDPKDRAPREVLKQLGVHNLTGDTCNIVPHREDVIHWRALKGLDQSGEQLAALEDEVKRAIEKYDTYIGMNDIWRAVTEAVANSVEHAYTKPRNDGFNGLTDVRWWMFFQLKDGYLSIGVCDLGCGYRQTIGETIPEAFRSRFDAMFLGKNLDAAAVQTAMEYGRSGTQQSNRGKGSRDALTILEKHGNGLLLILSNTGWIVYEYRDGKEFSRRDGGLGKSIRATVLAWKLPLQEKPND